ncbi:hypothetical protein F1721_18205 [Saccharopolyspora hirsuta]|uniref:Uncharacterized protein n=1 Tax=Saccharopolyspora hirsuta TaxID=1837 RepID=A0A5M7BNJ8_SACHI|nr:hypothetical protein [Saccharopolyspora hirsuta]KAA5831776.1 hypothetical protein F1721_18205 [Saccharopolyspora hirsuta]
MRIDEVERILAQHTKQNKLTLPSTAFGAGDVADLVRRWLGGNLVVSGVSTKKSGDLIKVDGTVSMFGATDRAVKGIEFGLVDSSGNPTSDGTPAVYIPLSLPREWTFAAAFPATKNSVLDGLGFVSGPTLHLTSVARKPGNGVPALGKGVTFDAPKVKRTGLLHNFVALLESGGQVTLSGQIEIGSGDMSRPSAFQPKLTLRSTAADAGSMGTKFQLEVVTDLGPPIKHRVRVAAVVTIGSSDPILLTADLDTGAKILELTGTFTPRTHQTAALSTWAGGSLSGTVGKGFTLGNAVSLQRLVIHLNAGKTLAEIVSDVRLELGLSTTWEVVKDYFTAGDITAGFTIANPFGGGPREITATARGKVVLLDGIVLLADAVFFRDAGGVTATFGMSTASPVNLVSLMRKLGLSLTDAPELTMSNLEITAVAPAGEFTLTASVSSTWQLSLGVASVKLTQASVVLDYSGKSKKLTGEISAEAELLPPQGKSPLARFNAHWEIPKKFTLEGRLPTADLTALIKTFDKTLVYSDELPKVKLTEVVVRLAIAGNQGLNTRSGTECVLGVTGTVDVNNNQVSFLALARKHDGSTEFIGAIWTQGWTWYPDVLSWIKDCIAVKASGLALSTRDGGSLPADPKRPPNLPVPLARGVTFFTTVELKGVLAGALKPVFGGPAELQLTGLIAKPLSNSELSIALANRSKNGASGIEGVQFTGIQLRIVPKRAQFDLRAAFDLTFWDLNKKKVTLKLALGGMVSLNGELAVYFVLAAGQGEQWQKKLQGSSTPPATSPTWQEPFGLKGLEIKNFFGVITVGSMSVSLGAGGALVVRSGKNSVQLDLAAVGGFKGEVPYLDAFVLVLAKGHEQKEIVLGDLIRQFTDQNSQLVKLTDQITFRKFSLAVVLAPNGCTDPRTQKHWPFGFRAAGDVTLFGYRLVFDVRIVPEQGIDASGSVDKPIVLGDGVFQLSDSTGKKGPEGAVNTTVSLGPSTPYVFLSGKLDLLGMSAMIRATVKDGGWEFTWRAAAFIFTNSVSCALRDGKFTAAVGGSLSFQVKTTKPVKIGEVVIIPSGLNFSATFAMAIAIAIDPKFSFAVRGWFRFGSQKLTPEQFNLDSLRNWTELKASLQEYFASYPDKIFHELVSCAEKWAKAVGEGLLKGINDVARVLKDAFNVAASEAGKLLKLAGYTAEKAVEALHVVWNMTKDQVIKVLQEVWKFSEGKAKEIVDKVWQFLKSCSLERAAKML